MRQVTWLSFLKDVLVCALGSYGGPEAHYGIFSSYMVGKKKYLTDEELTELIGLFSLVPGPSSTQTMTSIGYHVGGPLLALLTFLVWALPAILIMTGVGIFFDLVKDQRELSQILDFLPALALAFIMLAALKMTKKMVKTRQDCLLFVIMFLASWLFFGKSVWVLPGLLLLGGLVTLFLGEKEERIAPPQARPKWFLLGMIIVLAVLLESLAGYFSSSFITLISSFYRYGYSIMGGGQVMIPLMIQDLVFKHDLLSHQDFLSGYAIDQAIPGPLFSFAAFVAARATEGSTFSFLSGLIGGLTIFLPGLFLVYFIFPLWKIYRQYSQLSHFLKGVSITAASFIAMTGVTQLLNNQWSLIHLAVMLVSLGILLTKKLPAPLLVLVVALLGLVI